MKSGEVVEYFAQGRFDRSMGFLVLQLQFDVAVEECSGMPMLKQLLLSIIEPIVEPR